MVSDASGTATEIANELRAWLVGIAELTGVITGTGTATAILTGAKGVKFAFTDTGTVGVLAVAETVAGTPVLRSPAGTVIDVNSTEGVWVSSVPGTL